MDVSVLIVTYNSAGEIRRCLASLERNKGSLRQEVIVLDNASKDCTREIIEAEFPGVRLIASPQNLGFAAGVNEAARHARGLYLLLLNPDTEVTDYAVERVVQFAEGHPKHGFYGGRTFKPDGSLEPSSCWGQPTTWSLLMFATGLSTAFSGNGLFDPESLGRWERNTVREVGVITGCFLLVTQAAWKELDGFDERFWMYGEDVDLAMRARARGYRPVICPDAQLVHEIGRSSETPVHKMILLFRGKAELVRRHWRGPSRIAAQTFLAWGVALRAKLCCIQQGGSTSGKWAELWNRRNEWINGYSPSRVSAAAEGFEPAKALS